MHFFREIMTQFRGRVDFSLTCREPFPPRHECVSRQLRTRFENNFSGEARGFNELSSVTLSNAIYRFIMTAVATYNVMTSFCELIRNLRLCSEMTGAFRGILFRRKFFFLLEKKVFINFHFADWSAPNFSEKSFHRKIYFLLCSVSHLRLLGKFLFVTGLYFLLSFASMKNIFQNFSGT